MKTRRCSVISVVAVTLGLGALSAAEVPSPREVLNLPVRENLPRNGEGDFVRLNDGRIMLAYTEYWGKSMLDHAPAHLVARYSSDEGETWTEPVEIVGREGAQNVMALSLLRLDAERIALFFLRKNSSKDCMPVMKVSSDDGRTWSATREILSESEKAYYVLNNARATRLKGGRILLPLANHGDVSGAHGADAAVSCAYSDDNGVTWRKGTEYRPKDIQGAAVLAQEPGVVELNDGRVYMYMRTDRGRQWQAFSKDGGATWDDFGPSPIYGPRGPATIRRMKGGELLLVWNDHEGHPEYMKTGPQWLIGIRAPLTLAVSRDEGKTWTNRKTLESDLAGFYCYFALFEAKDGLLLSYYNKPYLTAACVKKVPYEWLAEAGQCRNLRDISYAGTADAARAAQCRLDLKLPVTTNRFPTVVWLHGGGLTAGRRHFIGVGDWIAQAAVGYRLMSETNDVRGAACIDDAAAAVAWTLDHIAEFGGDPKQVYVAGKSAGAYLTMMVGMAPAYLAKYGHSPKELAGLVPISGQATTHFAVRKFAGDATSQYIPKIDEMAPLHWVSAEVPPILSVCGQPPWEWPGRSEENRLLIASCVALGHKRAHFVELDYCNHCECGGLSVCPDVRGGQVPARKKVIRRTRQ